MRVLVVDDTVVYRKAVSEALASLPDVEVIGSAPNGKIALHKIEQLRPDLMTLDLEMPGIDGLGVLRRLKESGQSVGTIILSATTDAGARSTLAALDLGAFDFVPKPVGGSHEEAAEELRNSLRLKIEAFSRTREIRRALAGDPPLPSARLESPPSTIPGVVRRMNTIVAGPKCQPRVVALGISTGGPQALAAILPELPADLPVPLLIVQHMPPKFTRSLAESLNDKCSLTVSEAEDGQLVEAGNVLIAPGGQQMKVHETGEGIAVRVGHDPPENSCRPSVDYLFRSVAHVYGAAVVGIIMTGMGSDGALGCRLLKRCGATIVVQDEASCVVYGMPRVPTEEGLADIVAPLDRIAAEITGLARRKEAVCG